MSKVTLKVEGLCKAPIFVHAEHGNLAGCCGAVEIRFVSTTKEDDWGWPKLSVKERGILSRILLNRIMRYYNGGRLLVATANLHDGRGDESIGYLSTYSFMKALRFSMSAPATNGVHDSQIVLGTRAYVPIKHAYTIPKGITVTNK